MNVNGTSKDYANAVQNIMSLLSESVEYSETQDDKTFRRNTTTYFNYFVVLEEHVKQERLEKPEALITEKG